MIKNKINKTIKIIIKSILFLISFFFLALLIHDYLDPTTTLKHLFINKYKIESNSMKPILEKNDKVLIMNLNSAGKKDLKSSKKRHDKTINKKFDPNNEKGDIVVFKIKKNNETKFIIHRVIENDPINKTITTLGDANNSCHSFEEKIPYNDIIGIYVGKIKTNYTIIFFIILIFIQILLYCI